MKSLDTATLDVLMAVGVPYPDEHTKFVWLDAVCLALDTKI
jgi:hypothetical protein